MNRVFLTPKLLNPIYAAQKIWLYGRSRYVLGEDDIIFAVFPKTGSTWVRFFLFNLLTEINGNSKSLSFDNLDSTMAEFGHRSMFNPWPFALPRLIKTHQPYNLLFKGHRAMMVVRDPRDIMVSYYYHARAKVTNDSVSSLYDAVYHPRWGLEAFFQHYQSWKDIVGLVVKYEELKTDPLTHFRRISTFCEIEAEDAQIERAIQGASMSNMRKAQQASTETFKNFDKNFVFARKGTVAQWVEYFDADLVAYYEQLKQQYRFDLYT